MSNFGKCTVVIEGNAVKHVNDFLMPLCWKSDEYVCGKCFNVQSKLVDDVLYVNFESNWDLEILDKIIEICESESGRYYYNYYNESMLGDSESNDKEGKYFTKHEGYEKLLECDFVYYKPKFNFDNLWLITNELLDLHRFEQFIGFDRNSSGRWGGKWCICPS